MTNIVVYFTQPGFEDSPFDEPEYRTSYHEFGTRVAAKGATLWLARGPSTFLGHGAFARGWRFDAGVFIECPHRIDADVVFNKGEDLRFEDGTTVVNDARFGDLCTLKDRTYALFGDIMPRTLRVDDTSQLQGALDALPSPLVVAKPLDGACGRGVVIGTRDEVLAAAHTYPILAQEFIDTSAGIPGIMTGTHDCRLIVVGGQLVYAAYKLPKPGSLISNISLGGTFHLIPDDGIPADARALLARIDAQFTAFPHRVYCADMCRDADGRWRLIELNAPPALDATLGEPQFERYHALLADLLLAAARG